MLELLDRTPGQRLDGPSYLADFNERFWRIGREGFWKLERLQNYQEPGFASWEAFRSGDWARALRLIDEMRVDFERHLARVRDAGFDHHRVRVVEEPITPYVQWELHVLQAKDQCGEDVAVVTVDQIQAFESVDPLPDLVVLGSDAAYDVHYAADGIPDGATLFTAPAAIACAREFIQQLHQSGERLETYFPRRIAGLGAPQL
ncbi:hypothetical protein EDD99_5021 [Streptomyces sp. 846.5]|nr:DUF6879 family protein [Streptomyces sp. 846.5]TDU06462.1 hypothetical protein EDD99_5021 [Streptomyces sp. 846.5]